MGKHILALLLTTLLFSTPSWATNPWKDPERIKYPPLRFSPPPVKKEKLPTGITVFFLENHELPIVHISLLIRAGSIYDPPGKEGLAELTAQVMRTGGAGKWTGDEIDVRLDRMAAHIEPIVRDEFVLWRINALSKDVKEVWEIFQTILRNPVLDPRKLKTALDLKKGELKRLSDIPDKFAFREFQRLYFRGNLQGRQPTEASLDNISREDIVEFHRRHYFPENITVAVSGAVRREEIFSLLTVTFTEAWSNQPLPLAISPPNISLPDKPQCLIKDTPQAVIITGHPAPPRLSPDYYAFEVLDFILGSGGFRSRIFQEVRTNQGLSYATGSFYRPKNNYGLFGTYAITQNKSAFLAFSTIERILLNIQKDLGNKEVERAKNAIIHSFVFDYSTPRQIVEREAEAFFFGWPDDFWSSYIRRVKEVSLSMVTTVARKYLVPHQMMVFILGKEEACTQFQKYERMDRKP
ncbi:MAG: insulinase family protein [Syntrophales bacterium]|nr:insulinase family protein [Syntrophales bacterium]